MSTIKLDYDNMKIEDVNTTFWNRLVTLQKILKIRLTEIRLRQSSSRNGYHIIARTKTKLEPAEIVLIQLALGSDYVRELMQYRRYKLGWKTWNVLFEEKLCSQKKIVKIA